MATTTYITGGTHTRTVAARERTHLWRRHVTDNHGRLDFSFANPDAFTGGTRVQRCGDLQLVEFWSDPVLYDRRPDAADRDSDDSVRLLLPLSGPLLVSGPSADRRLTPGLAAAVSMAAGFRVEQQRPAHALVLSLPSRLWEGTPPREPVVWELDHGGGAVFSATLREVAAQRAHLDANSFVQACESAAMLLPGRSGRDGDLLSQARAVARQHADDTDFDPATLAERLGWSLRSVQLALRRAGTTPAEVIRTQRLERAATRLRHPAWRAHTISHVAHACGFGSLSAFNAAFRSYFGCTPADLRAGNSQADPHATRPPATDPWGSNACMSGCRRESSRWTRPTQWSWAHGGRTSDSGSPLVGVHPGRQPDAGDPAQRVGDDRLDDRSGRPAWSRCRTPAAVR